jgi:hypothetical protein
MDFNESELVGSGGGGGSPFTIGIPNTQIIKRIKNFPLILLIAIFPSLKTDG